MVSGRDKQTRLSRAFFHVIGKEKEKLAILNCALSDHIGIEAQFMFMPIRGTIIPTTLRVDG
jgi:hypothetical protein